MTQLLKLLESGKSLSGGIALAVMGVIIAFLTTDFALQSVGVLIAALALGYVCIFQVRWSRRTYSLTNMRIRALERKVSSSHEQLQGDLTSISADLVESVRNPDGLAISEVESSHPLWSSLLDNGDESSVSGFVPSLIPASEVRNRPQAHVPGRLAADMATSDDGHSKLRVLMNTEELKSTRVISAIINERTLRLLQTLGNVHLLHPNYSGGVIAKGSSYLIVEEDMFATGAWAGGLTTQRTDLFLKLFDSILEARKKGVVVIVISSELPQHFTATLRKYADIIIGNDAISEVQNQGALLPICAYISAALKTEEM